MTRVSGTTALRCHIELKAGLYVSADNERYERYDISTEDSREHLPYSYLLASCHHEFSRVGQILAEVFLSLHSIRPSLPLSLSMPMGQNLHKYLSAALYSLLAIQVYPRR